MVYRLTRNEKSITEKDFLSLYEIHKMDSKVKVELLNNDQYYALSVYDDIDDAKSTYRKFPKKFKDICFGKTIADDGCVRLDPTAAGNSHRSWWLYKNAEPIKYFKLLEKENE